MYSKIVYNNQKVFLFVKSDIDTKYTVYGIQRSGNKYYFYLSDEAADFHLPENGSDLKRYVENNCNIGSSDGPFTSITFLMKSAKKSGAIAEEHASECSKLCVLAKKHLIEID